MDALTRISRANARRFAPALREADIARACSDLLALDGWRMLITDPVSNRQLGKGFGEVGMADRLYIRYSKYANDQRFHKQAFGMTESEIRCEVDLMWIEFKRVQANGNTTKATPHQKAWHEAERARGALTLIAGQDFPATIEGFAQWYAGSGLMRKAR